MAFGVQKRNDFEYAFIVDGDQRTSAFGLQQNGNNFYHFEKLPRAVRGFGDGFASARCVLNRLHCSLAQEGFTHTEAMAVAEDVILVSRSNLAERLGYALVARDSVHSSPCPCNVLLPGKITAIVLAAELFSTGDAPDQAEVLSTESGRVVFHPDVGSLAQVREE